MDHDSKSASASTHQLNADGGNTKSKNRKPGRRRRGKKDVILNFSKHRIAKANFGADPPLVKTAAAATGHKANKANKNKKLTLTTSSKDYDGQLGLPETVAQRDFETTGEFFRRLDRLVAKAKVEANLDERFDTKVSRGAPK